MQNVLCKRPGVVVVAVVGRPGGVVMTVVGGRVDPPSELIPVLSY